MAWVYADDIALTYTPGIVENNQGSNSISNVSTLPNPFIEEMYFNFQLPGGLAYRITIFDVLGRPVRTLNGISSGDVESVRWDRRSDSGVAIDAGVYLYRFESNTVNSTGKVVVR